MGNCAGIDWASEKHDLLIENDVGAKVLTAVFPHDEAGIGGLCRALVRHDVQLVAIERPDGLLADRILDAGIRVIALHPNQVAPHTIGSGRQAANLISSTASCFVSWRAPTPTASGSSSPTATRGSVESRS